MASEDILKEGRFQVKVGDLVFETLTVNDIGLPPFPPAALPGGYAKRINDVQNLPCYPDDVFLATFPKCGTHWVSEILTMLVQGKTEYQRGGKGMAMLEAVPDLEIVEKIPRPRVLNAHFPYRWLPKYFKEDGGKVVHVRRNPKDAYVSYFHHAKMSREYGQETENMTWSQFFDACVVNKGCTYGGWFSYEKEIEAAKKTNKNIYTVLFENLKKYPEREITKLANFLEVKVTDEFVREVTEKCSFKILKQAKESTEPEPEMIKMIEVLQKTTPHIRPPQIFRKGEVGDWKNHFTVAQNELFDDIYRREMKDTDIEVCYEI